MDPAASTGRLESIMNIIESKPEDYEIINSIPAKEEDILRVHGKRHYDYIKNDPLLYELASLAAGGSILAAEEGERIVLIKPEKEIGNGAIIK